MKGLFAFSGLCIAGVALAQQKPNIIFILTDDMGYYDLGCYGNPYNETPHIDSLAKAGMRYTQAYAACPVSSPSRAAILTGKYPARLQLTNFLVGDRTEPNSPILPAHWKPYLESREITIAEILKKQGYSTGHVGKWHLGGADSIAPWGQGFDYSRLIGKNGLDYYNYSIYLNDYQHEFVDHGTNYLTDKLTEYSIDFIKQNKEKPFFLYLAYSAPHVLTVPRADKLKKYLMKYNKYKGKYNPYYAAMIESIDDGVGEIIRTLRNQHLLENTIIIFTSDNGGVAIPELGPIPTNISPLNKWKGHVYEGGIRIPLIMSWGSMIAQESECNQYITGVDFFPTLADIIGNKDLPAHIDGVSFKSLIQNSKSTTFNHGPIFWHYPHFSNQESGPAAAVRLGDYKLIENYETNKLELYNLTEDFSETTDISAKMPDKTKELYKLLNDWRKSVNAQMPIPNPDYKK